jgi:hypothetical protein
VVSTLVIRKSGCTLSRSPVIVNYSKIVNNGFAAAG